MAVEQHSHTEYITTPELINLVNTHVVDINNRISKHKKEEMDIIEAMQKKIDAVEKKLQQIYDAVVGTPEKPGICMVKRDFEKHIEQGDRWRMALIGIIFTIILQIGTFVWVYSKLTSTVENNSDLIRTRILPSIDRMSEHMNVDEARWKWESRSGVRSNG